MTTLADIERRRLAAEERKREQRKLAREERKARKALEMAQAAAPDLLAALIGVMRDCECVIVDNRSRAAWDAANDAIAKAEGRK